MRAPWPTGPMSLHLKPCKAGSVGGLIIGRGGGPPPGPCAVTFTAIAADATRTAPSRVHTFSREGTVRMTTSPEDRVNREACHQLERSRLILPQLGIGRSSSLISRSTA